MFRVPELPGGDVARITLATPPGRPVDLSVGAVHRAHADPDEVAIVEVPLDDEPVVVIANVGNVRRADGYGLDLGRFEVDRGQHDRPGDVPAWCGGAVLLRRAYLADVGPFDERLFLYYEDLELSLRGADRGWRYRYEPASLVDHRVGSSGAGSGRVEQLRERNRLLVLARHGSVGQLLRELVRFVAVTLSYGRREIAAPVLRGAAPCGWLVKIRVMAFLGALPRIPGQIASGRADRRRARESPPFPDC